MVSSEIRTGNTKGSQKQRPEDADPHQNGLLASLKPEDLAAVLAVASVVRLKIRMRLYRQDGIIGAVYFPLTFMVSLLVTTEGSPQVEVATIGKEGVVGASELIQAQGAMGLNLVQLPGLGLRVETSAFLKLLDNRPAVRVLIHHHFYALTRQILYGAACNRVHSMQERCARWLLMTHDRASQDTFPLTQEFLSHMLGVRRATVNVATGMLKRAGFIQYVRGRITVVDRAALESASCGCYQAIKKAYDSLLPKPTSGLQSSARPISVR